MRHDNKHDSKRRMSTCPEQATLNALIIFCIICVSDDHHYEVISDNARASQKLFHATNDAGFARWISSVTKSF